MPDAFHKTIEKRMYYTSKTSKKKGCITHPRLQRKKDVLHIQDFKEKRMYYTSKTSKKKGCITHPRLQRKKDVLHIQNFKEKRMYYTSKTSKKKKAWGMTTNVNLVAMTVGIAQFWRPSTSMFLTMEIWLVVFMIKFLKVLQQRMKTRPINKKGDILKKLCPLMEESNRLMWGVPRVWKWLHFHVAHTNFLW